MRNILYLLTAIVITLVSCVEEKQPVSKPKPKKAIVQPPVFSADSAYQFIQDQVDFGPRVPNTEEHALCAEFLANKLESYGGKVVVQESIVTAYDGTKLGMKNIIGQFGLEKKRRVLLFAHWDTRPWADKDDTENNWNTPIDGANDGGSGVGVLLEIARVIQATPPEYGVDIIFFDTEDYGSPNFEEVQGKSEDWCLGSQYWSKNPHVKGYKARYGILLDMVGAKDAKFPKEGTSLYYAPSIVRKVWKNAKKLNHTKYFINKNGDQTTDDHLFVNAFAGIPSINIVEYHVGSGYGHYHHTIKDNMDNISKETLNAVGETVLYTIYNN